MLFATISNQKCLSSEATDVINKVHAGAHPHQRYGGARDVSAQRRSTTRTAQFTFPEQADVNDDSARGTGDLIAGLHVTKEQSI